MSSLTTLSATGVILATTLSPLIAGNGQITRADRSPNVVFVDTEFGKSKISECPSLESENAPASPSHGDLVVSAYLRTAKKFGFPPGNVYCIPLRVGHENPKSQDLSRALRHATQLDPSVINLSLEVGAPSKEVRFLISALARKRVKIIVAAGNTYGLRTSGLAAVDGVIAVGAKTDDGKVAPYSAVGGVADWEYGSYTDPNGHRTYEGTSIAAAVYSARVVSWLWKSNKKHNILGGESLGRR